MATANFLAVSLIKNAKDYKFQTTRCVITLMIIENIKQIYTMQCSGVLE